MKKAFLVAISAVAVAASVALADDSAKSVNAVGVVKYTIPANGALTCIALPLNPLGDVEWKWGDTSLAEQMDIGSAVYFWDGTHWKSYEKGKLKGWIAEAKNTVIEAGSAFFVKGPETVTTNKTISLLGELPTEGTLSYGVTKDELETRGVTMYPVEQRFGDSDLAAELPIGSAVYFWGGTRWKSYEKGKLKGWIDEAKNTTNFVGEGIFIKSASNLTVQIERPFEWED